VAIAIGAGTPEVEGVDLQGVRALVFFKVTCGTTMLSTPVVERLGRAYPGRVVGLGQDPAPDLKAFARAYGLSIPLVPDLDPYPASDAFGIVSAPTVVAIDAEDRVADVAESWDRAAWNRLSVTLARLLEVEPEVVSEPGDGLPAFKPG
jgi:hypothetical protein